MGRILRRDGYWHLDVQYGKIRIRKTTKISVARKDGKRAAQNMLTALLQEISQGRFGQTTLTKITTFDELVGFLKGDYERRGLRSWRRAELSIKHLRPAFGRLPAAAITYASVDDYVGARRAAGARPGTIHAEVAALRRMLKLAVKHKRLSSLPVFPSLETSPAREGFLTSEQVDEVVSNLEQPVADLVTAIWVTGWRRREVQFLKWSDVDMKSGEFRLTEGRSKTKTSRVFPFRASPSLAGVMKGRQEARAFGSVYVFERSPGKPVKDFRIAWANACKAAGIPGRVPHDLRRSRARALSRAQVPQSVAMRLLGHKTPNMFLRYDVAATDDLADAVAAAEQVEPTRKKKTHPNE
jgi:integrase